MTTENPTTPTPSDPPTTQPGTQPTSAPSPAPQPQPATPSTPPKSETFQTAKEAIAEERERTSKITALCKQAGFPDLAGKHIENGDDIPTVQAALFKSMCDGRQPVGSDDGDPKPKDPDAALKADYATDAALCRQMGLEPVTEEEYIASRKVSA